MKIQSSVLRLTGISIVTISFVLTGLPAKSVTIGKPIIQGVVRGGTEDGLLNQSDSATGKGFGKSFKDDYIILGAENTDIANDANNTGTISNKYLVPFTLNQNDLQKDTQTFSFNLAFNGKIGGERNLGADFLLVHVYEGLRDGELLGSVGEPLLLRYADKTENLIPQAFSFTQSLNSNLFKANANYFLGFRLNEFDIAADTRNTAAGFNDVKINDVVPVPEPFTLLGTGTALGFGSFFKWKLSGKQKKKKIEF